MDVVVVSRLVDLTPDPTTKCKRQSASKRVWQAESKVGKSDACSWGEGVDEVGEDRVVC